MRVTDDMPKVQRSLAFNRNTFIGLFDINIKTRTITPITEKRKQDKNIKYIPGFSLFCNALAVIVQED